MINIEFDDEEGPQSPPEMVRVCTKCGRGFPSWAPSIAIDPEPVWWLLAARSGAPCRGRVIALNRETHIENIAKALLSISLAKKLEGSPL